MQKNYQNIVKRVGISTFVLAVSVLGVTNTACGDPVAPGSDIYCPTKITNFYPKADGTTKASEITYGTVKANSDGKCPDPQIEYKNQ
jgi:hypothetical protein